jgi:hypothetical protein
VDVILATIIIGLAVPAVLLLVSSISMQSQGSLDYATALTLANHTREMMSGLSFDDVRGFAGQSFSPPVDALGQPLPGMDQWQQSIAVQLVGDSLGQHLGTVESDTSAIAERVTVSIFHRVSANDTWGEVVTISWLKTRY